MISDHCEAKLHGFRRTADGVVVSFTIHPQEIPQALALDPLGTRYMLAFAQIGDDEQPVSPAGTHSQQGEKGAPATPDTDGHHPSSPRPAGEPKTPGERAVIRAALLPKDERFRAWLSAKWYRDAPGIIDEETAVRSLRNICCDCNSRRLIAEVPKYMDRFIQMETEYLMDTGQMARPR